MTVDSSGDLPPFNRSDKVGSGGFSDIFLDPNHSERLIKVLKFPLIGADAERLHRLLDVRDWVRPSDTATLTSRFAWPIEWWGDNTGITGFSMDEASPGCWFTVTVAGRTIRTLLQLKYLENAAWWQRRAVSSEPPDLPPDNRRELAIDWIDTIETLHNNGLAFGDISSNNICANLADKPTVYLFDVDSIGLPAEVEASQIRTVDWNAPEGLDAVRRDRSLAALLVWRLFTETRLGYPTQSKQHLLDAAGSTLIASHLEATYLSGDADALSEVSDGLRRLRVDEIASTALDQAQQTRYARLIHREAKHGSNARFTASDLEATTQLEFEQTIDEATSAERKRLIGRAAFAHPGYELDIRPDTGAYIRPTSIGQLRDLIYDAEFERLATNLTSQGLGDLETDPWLPRAIQHALVRANQPEMEIVESDRSATISWQWPEASYVNAVIIDVTAVRHHLSREVVIRHPGDRTGVAVIESQTPLEGKVVLRLAAKSRSGRVFAGSEQSASNFTITCPVPIVQGLTSTVRSAAHNEAPTKGVTVQDPVQVAAEIERERQAKSRRSRRRAATVAAALVAVSVVGLLGWRLFTTLAWETHPAESVFASDRDGDWEIYVRRHSGVVQQLTFNDHDDRNPVWHPSGKFIAFESNYDGDWELLRMNADGTDVRSYTFNTYADIDMAWSPDGTQLVFASDRDGDWEIYVRRHSGVVQQLTFNDHDDRNPVWHPSGKFIAFESNYDGDWELLRMNADGTDVRSYTFNTYADIDMAWNRPRPTRRWDPGTWMKTN